MLWIVFGVIVAALLAAAWWIDHSRRRRGVTEEVGPLDPYRGSYTLGQQNPMGGGDAGGGGGP
jgi:hypothetical protein